MNVDEEGWIRRVDHSIGYLGALGGVGVDNARNRFRAATEIWSCC